jgi:hypothetical protein
MDGEVAHFYLDNQIHRRCWDVEYRTHLSGRVYQMSINGVKIISMARTSRPFFSEIGKPGVKSRLLSKIRPQVIPAGLTGKPLGAGGRYRFELVSSFDILWPR